MLLTLTLVLFVLQLLDLYSTKKIIANGGHEQNPLMAYLFDKFGMMKVLTVKAIGLPAAAYVIGSEGALIALIIIYGLVLVHNWKSL